MISIYVFGSICRGEVEYNSDIDLLAITNEEKNCFDPQVFSIYLPDRIKQLWHEGNPFAWHLYYESKLIFASTDDDFINSLGKPAQYSKVKEDCIKFYYIFQQSYSSIKNNQDSIIFDFSSIFLCIRNVATCFSFHLFNKPIFSRNSAFKLGPYSLEICNKSYSIYEQSRILATRGAGKYPSDEEIQQAIKNLVYIENWMDTILKVIKDV